jgi:hypothetical protein
VRRVRGNTKQKVYKIKQVFSEKFIKNNSENTKTFLYTLRNVCPVARRRPVKSTGNTY